MMEYVVPALAVLLVVGVLVCWGLNLLGLPGNWLVILLVGVYAYFMPADRRADIGWGAIVGL